ncbi:MAG: hypothetical protein AAGI88_24105 [Pseudomonadota bacterium]
MADLREDVKGILFWTYAAVVLSTWALVSFLPIAGIAINESSIGLRVLQGVFLMSGFLGFCGAYLLYCFLRIPIPGRKRSKSVAKPLTAYASLWLAAYWGLAWAL